MTASVVNQQSSTATSGSTLVATLPGSRVTGNLLVLVTGFYGDGATLAVPTGGVGHRMAAYTRPVDGSETSPTITGYVSGESRTATVYQIAGHDGINAATQIADGVATISTPRATPALTTTVADCLIISSMYIQMPNNNDTWAWSAGAALTDFKTAVANGWYSHQGSVSAVKAAAGAITPPTVTVTGTNTSLNYAATNIAIAPGGAPPPDTKRFFFGMDQ